MEIGKNVRQISTYSKHVKLLRNSKYFSRDVPERDSHRNNFYRQTSK